jgi:hypothetical protein
MYRQAWSIFFRDIFFEGKSGVFFCQKTDRGSIIYANIAMAKIADFMPSI